MKAEYDFSTAKRGAVRSDAGKTRITLYLDDVVIAAFRAKAQAQGMGYQTLMNEALRAQSVQKPAKPARPLTSAVLRRILREELHSA